MGWAAWNSIGGEVEEESACGVMVVVSGGVLVGLSVAGLFLPREWVLPVLLLGFAGVSVGVGAVVSRRSSAPASAIGVFCGAPAVVMGALVGAGVLGAGLLWVLVAGAVGGAVVWVARRGRDGAVGDGGAACCFVCGYSLAGIEDVGGCPECGLGMAAGARDRPRGGATGRVWRMAAPARGPVGG